MSSVTRPPPAACSLPSGVLNGRLKWPFTKRTSGSQMSGPRSPVAKWAEKSAVSESR